MKKIFIAICLLTPFILCAQISVTDLECRTAAVNYAQHYMRFRNISDSNIVSIYDYKEDSKMLLKEVRFDNGLLIILSAHKNCKPVLVYSTSDQPILSKITDLPDGLRCFIDNYCGAIRFAVDSLDSQLINTEWSRLLELPIFDSLTRTNQIYGPFLTTRWGQTSSNDNNDCNAYNYHVETTSELCNQCESNNCPTGCIATAMAQIMNYWKYPVYLPYRTEQFDWCNMPEGLYKIINGVNNVNYETERNAIAKLMAACGQAADMDYCCKDTWYLSERCASFTFPVDARKALVKSFGYHSDADVKRRFYYSTKKWKRMLVDDIKNERPVLYSAVSYKNETENYHKGGHAFVCDGYDEDTEMFHFNWGHKEDYTNTWCTIDSIIEIGSYNYHWNHFERAIFKLYPDQSQDYCNFHLRLKDYYNDYYTVLGNTDPAPHLNIPRTASMLFSVPIDSSIPASWYTIPSGSASEYVAHEEIILQNGFIAQEGCSFHAYITPCESCESNTRSNEKQSVSGGSPRQEAHDLSRFLVKTEESTHDDITDSETTPLTVSLHPNPAIDNVTLTSYMEEDGFVAISLYNMFGDVYPLFEGHRGSGAYSDVFSLEKIPSGIYVILIKTNGRQHASKIIKL